MASIPTLLTLSITLSTLNLAVTLTDSANPARCGASLVLLAPCMPFVQGAGLAPPDQCCDSVAELIRDQADCVCSVIDSSSSFPINRTLVLALPSLCRVDLTDAIKTCRGLSLAPSQSPQPSKDGPNANYSAAAGPTRSLPKPLERARDQLIGKNNGGKKKLEKTLITFAFIVLMFLGIY
ncbi:hypothetical protein LUZ60_017694 [Juncus effusus]|nr:hypothetical protein LUZ60_017694 [Juncus effusus]